MNLEEWEKGNNDLVREMTIFYEEYQEKNSHKFNVDWVKANQEMCEMALKKFSEEIKNKIEEIMLIQ